MKLSTQSVDPYRPLFPIGLLTGAAGTAVWILFALGKIEYPGQRHADLMIGGFLVTYAAGFLMTAIPRFTGARQSQNGELALGTLTATALLLTGTFASRAVYQSIELLALLLIVAYAARRFLAREHNPPPVFVFVGLGLLMGVAGIALQLAATLAFIGGPAVFLGRQLFYQGMMLSLVLGVGSRLIPAILGWAELPRIQISKMSEHARVPRMKIEGPLLALAFTLAAGFVIEAFVHVAAGAALRALVTTFLAFKLWKLQRRPQSQGRMAFWLWISAWSTLLGTWVIALFPAFMIHGAHLMFIGGFGLMTLMIASRVTVSHGGYGIEFETRSRSYTFIGWLVVAAALTRVTAPLLPAQYVSHLAYAAACWIFALIFWAIVFVPKALRANS